MFYQLGKRVNAAQDDATTLATSQNLVNQIRTINQSFNNLNYATNVLQIADFAINSNHDMVLRFKELSLLGINDSLGNS